MSLKRLFLISTFVGIFCSLFTTRLSAAFNAPCVASTYTVYNAKTGTIRWGSSPDWIRHLTGTIYYPAGIVGATITVSGTGTSFTTEYSVGSVVLLQSSPGTAFGTVTAISSNTSMSVQLSQLISTPVLSPGVAHGKQTSPASTDNIFLGNSNIAVANLDAQVDVASAQASSITVNSQAASLSVTIMSSNTLTISSGITITQGSSNSYTNSVSVNAGVLAVTGTTSIGTHNAAAGYAYLILTTGTINFLGDLSFKAGRYYGASLTLSSSGTVNLYGNILWTNGTDIGQIVPGTTSNINFCSSTTTQNLYTGFGTGGDPWFSYANLYCNNTSSGGMVYSGTGNNAGQILNMYIQTGKFLNQLTSGKLLGGTLFQVANGATYETYGASANATVPTTFTTVDLAAASIVKIHTTDNPWVDHVTYGHLYLEPTTACGYYFKDATPAYTIAGNLYIGDGTNALSLIGQANTSIVVGGNLTIRTNGTFNANTKTIDTYVAGNWINNGTYSCGTSSVVLNGSAEQTVTNSSGTETFYNLVVNNTYTTSYAVVLNSPATATNTLTLTNGIVRTTTTNLLSLPATATSSQGSSVSFVDGPISKTGTTAFVFPVGNSNRWARIAIGAPSASTTFRAQYFATPYSDVINMATTPIPMLDHVSGKEYWNLDRTAGSGNATVTLYWEDASWSGIQVCDNSDLRVAHYNGSAWENNNNAVTTTGSCSGATAGTVGTSAVVTSFSPFTFGSLNNNNTLPIELVEFTAVPNKEKVDLKWSTATETSNSFFTIERSKDAVHFDEVVKVQGAGNSLTLREYFESDYQPFSGVSYYRLKQTDYNGNFKYSPIISVAFGAEKNILVYPNPSAKSDDLKLHISGYKSQEVLVVLRDLEGREFYSKVFVAEENNQFYVFDALKSTPAGTYIVVASSMDKVYHQKLIVK